MNKLYILGALALANVDASIAFLSGTSTYPLAYLLPSNGVVGSFTYTTSSDCYISAAVTSLGMNNIYHQYYSFALTKGSSTYTALPFVITGITPSLANPISQVSSYTGCYHSHLYNWMAQPQVAGTTATQGFGNAAVAYGYAMSGTAITACTSVTIVTSTLFKSNIFIGAQFQSSSGTYSISTALAATTTSVPFWGKVGPNQYYAKAATALTFVAPTGTASSGLITASAQNAYWDFMQTNVIMGMTQFGRGGGASTAPCGWWVVYFYEYPKGGQTYDVDTINVVDDGTSITINMWTDNSVVKAASAFVLTALAGLLF